jgi:hypothetical protein
MARYDLLAMFVMAGCSGATTDSALQDSVQTPGDSGTQDSGTVTDEPEAHVLTKLVTPGGCADLVLTLNSKEGDLSLVFVYRNELTKAAYESATGAAAATVDLASGGSLELWEGIQVDQLSCNDALSGSEEILTTWTAVSGTAQLSVISNGVKNAGPAYPGTGSITLTDVVLTTADQDDLMVPNLIAWTAAVGWLPG